MNSLLELWRGLTFDTQVNILAGLVCAMLPGLFLAVHQLFKRLAKAEERAVAKVTEQELYRGEPMRYDRDLPPDLRAAPMPKRKPPRSADDAEWDAKPVGQMTEAEIDREMRKHISRELAAEREVLRHHCIKPAFPPPPPPPEGQGGKMLVVPQGVRVTSLDKDLWQFEIEGKAFGTAEQANEVNEALRKFATSATQSKLSVEEFTEGMARIIKLHEKDCHGSVFVDCP